MQKVFMLIQRGMTDRTPVCVFPWEKPILEEIHGGNAQEISLEELCELRGATKIQKIKPRQREINGKKIVSDEVPSMRAQYEAMVKVNPDENPLEDPEAEFGRLAEKYGMHLQVNLPNVEKVYGSVGNFRRALKDYASGRSPDFVGETGPITEDKPVAEMSDKKLKEALKAMGVKFDGNSGREVLEELYTDHVAA
jgi:hypothetical protein